MTLELIAKAADRQSLDAVFGAKRPVARVNHETAADPLQLGNGLESLEIVWEQALVEEIQAPGLRPRG
jgi:hypothetical protein